MFLETIESLFIVSQDGSVMKTTIHTTTAITPYEVVTTETTTIDLGSVVLTETITTIEFPDGMILVAIERGILIPIPTSLAHSEDELASRRTQKALAPAMN